jgi:hypothetical protein
MKKTLAILGIPLLAVITSLASGVTSAEATRWVCSLTGKTVEKCCCVTQKDGKLYCTLAKKIVDTCCCKAAEKK